MGEVSDCVAPRKDEKGGTCRLHLQPPPTHTHTHWSATSLDNKKSDEIRLKPWRKFIPELKFYQVNTRISFVGY